MKKKFIHFLRTTVIALAVAAVIIFLESNSSVLSRFLLHGTNSNVAINGSDLLDIRHSNEELIENRKTLLLSDRLAAQTIDSKPSISFQITSKNIGNIFTESSPPTFNVTISGGTPSSLNYKIATRDKTWSATGTFPVSGATPPSGLPSGRNPEGGTAAQLSLPSLSRGLYDLTIDGGANSTPTTVTTAVLFNPDPPSANSRWGTYTVGVGSSSADTATNIATIDRIFGNSWSRLNFFLSDYENLTFTGNTASVQFTKMLSLAKALRVSGLYIMGEVFQMPQAISANPTDTGISSEGDPGYARVKPANYLAWENLMQQLASAFAGTIDTWELWNEADVRDFWLGSAADFAELTQRTIKGLKAGNPKAKIICGSFTQNGSQFLDAFLRAGGGQGVDAFSFHADDFSSLKAVLASHNISKSIPIWQTEEHGLVGLSSISQHASKIFHFLDRQFSVNYDGFPCLVDPNFYPLPAGVTYSVAAHVIGNGKLLSKVEDTNAQIYVFDKGGEQVLVTKLLKLGLNPGSVTLAIAPLSGKKPEVLDAMGKPTPLDLTGGQITLPVSEFSFVRNAATIKVVKYTPPTDPHVFSETEFLVQNGTWGDGLSLNQAASNNPINGFKSAFLSVSKSFLSIVAKSSETYTVKISLTAAKSGRYKLFFMGVTTYSLGTSGEWVSPFSWNIDDSSNSNLSGNVTLALPSLWRYSTDSHVKNTDVGTQMQFVGGPEVYQTLGTVDLSEGSHTFKLQLTKPRALDGAYATYIEGVVLRQMALTEG